MKRRLSFFLSLTGALLCSSEFFLKLTTSKSLCQSEGCILATKALSINFPLFDLAGSILFTLLAIAVKKDQKKIVDLLLIPALATEGLLTAFQLKYIGAICYSCLAIFTILTLIAITQLSRKQIETYTAFGCFITVLIFSLALLPETKKLTHNKPVLVIDKQCLHCKNLFEECKKCGLRIETVEAKNLLPLLRCFGINEVPALVVKKDSKTKEIIIGKSNIENYIKTHLLANKKELLQKTGFKNLLLNPLEEKDNQKDICTIEKPCM